MKKEVEAALITGIFGLVGTITAAIIGVSAGKTIEQKNTLNEVQATVATIDGDHNQIIFNDIREFVSDYVELKVEHSNLQNSYDDLNELCTQKEKELSEAKSEIINLQKELNALTNNYNTDIVSRPNVEYSNISLIINGIESGYVDKVVTINNETFYSIGFLKYLVDNQAVSSDTSKLFVGTVQSEDKMPISLFELEPFTEGYISEETNMEDNYNNVYEDVLKIHTISNSDYENLINCSQEYYINYNYSTFSFDVFFPKDAEQDTEYEIIIYGDGRQLKTFTINRKSKIEHIEVDIQGVEFLQIVGRHTQKFFNSHNCHVGMVNPYLYP